MRLEKLFENTGIEIDNKMKDIEICDICYDSRKVTPGSLFVAIKGFKSDGHMFTEKAISQGAAAIVGENECDAENYIRCESSRKVLAEISANFFGHPAKQMKIVGITGTNGKTTTSYLVKKILELKGHKCSLIGTNQIIIGDEVTESERTTPESRDLQELFAKMKKSGSEYVVMEVSSHSLELDRVHGIEFEVGVFTNLTQDHLDFHKTMENYAAAKAKLFEMSKKSVVNADDAYCELMSKNAKDVLTYGIDSPARLKAENICLRERGIAFDCVYGGERRKMRLDIPGRFSVYNALAACGAALALGMSGEDIEKGLVIARGVKGRLEVVPVLTPYTVIIDYAHTPDGLKNVIGAVRDFAKKRVITLFGCGGDRDKTKRPLMGKIAEELSDFVVVTSDNPRGEEPMEIIESITGGMTGKNHIVIENRKDAIRYALEHANEGDVIILAGKGHETYQVFKNETIHFDEREIVKQCIKNK